MDRAPIPTFHSEAELGLNPQTGQTASPEDFGARLAESMGQLGDKITQGGATVAEAAEMHRHVEAQQWVSKTMTQHQNTVDKYMADPKNYSDPQFAKNVQDLFSKSLPQLQSGAPNRFARNQLNVEYNDFQSTRMESAMKTQTDMTLQRGFNDFALAPNAMLDSYRTNLKSPNIDASGELYKQADDLFKKVEMTYGKVAPEMARELKDQLTSQLAYGAVNTNPDLAQKILNRGYIEGRTRHFLEDAIFNARGAIGDQQKQTAVEATKGLLQKADMFPDQVIKGFPATYYESNGFKPKEAQEMSEKLQYQLDVNKDFATVRDQISGMSESALLSKQDELYNALKSGDPSSDKFDHDSQVYDRVGKFVAESIRQLHEDPIAYLGNNNPQLKSMTQAYRDDPSPQKFESLNSALLRYEGSPLPGDDPNKYLNLPMHEMSLLDKSQSEEYVRQISSAGPSDAGKILHGIIQQYNPRDQGMVLNDLVDHGKLPADYWAMERTYGAPFQDKLSGAIQQGKQLRDTIGKVKGNSEDDLGKILATDTQWNDWSKNTASDNFQRQDIVSGTRSAVISYSLGMIQDGMTAEAATHKAVEDLTEWGKQTIRVNGHNMWVNDHTYPGTTEQFSQAVKDSISRLDVSQIKMTGEDGRPVFPVLALAGHQSTANEALRAQLQSHVVPHLNRDGNSFSLYYEDGGNLFQLRDTSDRPFNMDISDLPTYSRERVGYGAQRQSSERTWNRPDRGGWATVTHWPHSSASEPGPMIDPTGENLVAGDQSAATPPDTE
jgi:hypothetical protein